MGKLKDAIEERKRLVSRVEKVGGTGVNKQDKRRRGIKTPKGMTRDVQQRMSEYKRGSVIDKVKVYKNPGNK